MYLTGVHHEVVASSRAFANNHLGLLITPHPIHGSRYPAFSNLYPFCAFDNDIFANDAKFTVEKYLSYLESALETVQTRILFATAPDVIGDFEATLERSLPVLPLLHSLNLPAALVLQDGATAENIPWNECDAVFIGGTDGFKLDLELQADLIAEAKRRGKWVHVGRVNGGPRFRTFAALGADSADGTHLRFEPTKNIRNIDRWVASWHGQERLFA